MKNKSTQVYIVAALLVVLAAAAMYFLLIQATNTKRTEVAAQVETQRGQNSQLNKQIADLKKLEESLPAQEPVLEALQAKLPTSINPPALVEEFAENAATAGVKLNSIGFSQPAIDAAYGPAGNMAAALTPPGVAAPGRPAAAGAPAPAAAPGAAPAAAPGVAADVTAAVAALTKGEEALYATDVTFSVTGPYASVRAFVKQLETQERAFLVTSISLTSAEPGVIRASITGRFFTLGPKPATARPAAAAAAEPAQ